MVDAAMQMDRMYRWQRHIYDVTRKPYLIGRDSLIQSLGVPDGGVVLEIGCGTGRNLIKAARSFPNGRFFGFDISQAMLEKARGAITHAGMAHQITIAQGDGTNFDTAKMFGIHQFDRVFISYSLSMIPEWFRTLELATGLLAPGGALLIADFYDCKGLPAPVGGALYRWLNLFDVEPRVHLETVLIAMARDQHLNLDFQRIYGGYAVSAMLRRPYTGSNRGVIASLGKLGADLREENVSNQDAAGF